MRELIERFSYRYQLWREEQEAGRWGPDPAHRNPLRFVAAGLVVAIMLGIIEPFVFHRSPRVLEIAFVPSAFLFLILYRLKSPWAWHICVVWLTFTFFAYWILRLAGYSPYQPRPHEPLLLIFLFHLAVCSYGLVWLFRRREPYLRYIHGTSSSQI